MVDQNQRWRNSLYVGRTDVLERGQEFTLSNLDRCIVNLLDGENDNASSTSIYIKDVKGSLLMLGCVRGSVLMHNVDNCVVVVACHQVRI